MTWDIIIKGGTIIDGTGAERTQADIAIADGQIGQIGRITGPAHRTIDADGALITPGFVDIHTHYDGQVSWDQALTPSCQHGVTTAVMGNCGVGFAPVRKGDQERLIQLMEGVEDIPGVALAEGMRWNWESIPEYMDAIDALPHTIDFAVQVTHDPLRVYVMGDRAIAQEQATEDDIAQMKLLARQALEAGAVGISTGRTDNHRAADGSPTPASEASERELRGLAQALHGLDHGVIQAVSDFDMYISPKRFEAEFNLLEQMVDDADGHPMSLSLMQRGKNTQQWRWIIERAEKAAQHNRTIRLQVAARGIGVLLGLQATFHPFIGFPSYKAIAHLPLEERVRIMSDPAFKARVLTETSEPIAGDGSPVPPMADEFLANLEFVAMRLYRLGDNPDYEPKPETSILAEAYRKGLKPLELLYDAMLADEGRELLYFPIYNYLDQNLDAVHAMLSHPLALPGLSDGGAHVGIICDASFPTTMLTHWTRDRARGPRLPLEQVIKMMTHDTAQHIGFHDRGTIAVGKRADLNIIDYDNLTLHRPRLVNDLPAGGKRLLQEASGYLATLVGGQVILEHDALTNARPGRLVRLGQ